MKTYVFPGQGSQSRGMGKELFDQFPEFTRRADDILGYSIKSLCTEDPHRQLNKTEFTQPALYVVNALSYFNKIQVDTKPDYVAGHSLGEFNALLAAECYDFETGLTLVKKRGELMAQAPEGGMAAILNCPKELVESRLRDQGLKQVNIANFNTHTQIVISGAKDEIIRAEQYFNDGDIRYIPLNTSGAFHSPFMKNAKQEFETFIAQFQFLAPKIPVISNVSAREYDAAEISSGMTNQLDSNVLWASSIEYLMNIAGSADSIMSFEELGNGDVLTKMIKKIIVETGIQANVVDKIIPRPDNRKIVDSASRSESKPDLNGSGKAFNSTEKAQEMVKSWNLQCPVGTKVKSTVVKGEKLFTRSPAVVLFGHRAAVYLEGYKGYFDLTELEVV